METDPTEILATSPSPTPSSPSGGSNALSRDLVIAAYRLILGREPESEEAIDAQLSVCSNPRQLRDKFLQSEEFAPTLERLISLRDLQAQGISPADVYTGCSEEDLEIIHKYFRQEVQPAEGFVTDKLGVRTRISSLWKEAKPLAGTVSPLPIPADSHAHAIEWVGLLKAIRSTQTRGSLRAMELGAGWGPWVVAAGVAARNLGITNVHLLAVEADPTHFAFLRQHFLDNGLNPEQHRLLNAAVGIAGSRMYWPLIDPNDDWGARPICAEEQNENSTKTDYRGVEHTQTQEIEVVPFDELLGSQPRWDLVHVDVQGDEAKICAAARRQLDELVHWLVIGTHSRLIEGQLLELLSGMGWILENERPVRFEYRQNPRNLEYLTTHDGTQVWRNPKLD